MLDDQSIQSQKTPDPFTEPVTPPPLEPAFIEPWSPGRLVRMLRLFGPAAVVASVAIGAGETIIVVRAGAWMGYGLLWLVLVAVLAKAVCVTYFLGRYTAISGESLGSRLVRAPGPRGWILVLLVLLELGAVPFLWAAIARPSGELLGYLLGNLLFADDAGPARQLVAYIYTLIFGNDLTNTPRWIATGFIVIALGLSLPTHYRALEVQQIAICGILVLGTIIGTVLVRPDLFGAVQGLLSFGHIPAVPDSAPPEFKRNALSLIAVTFGYIGGSVMTYLVYADFISLHRWGMTGHPQIDEIRARATAGTPGDYLPTAPADVAAVRRSAAPIRWDVACGAIVLLVVTASFMISGAAVLFPLREAGEARGAFEGWRLLTDQAEIWNAIHPKLVWVYYISVLAALWGTLQAYPDVYARGVAEYLKAIWPERTWPKRRVQAIICVFVFVSATAVVWSDVKFDTMTLTVNFLATTLGVAIAMLAGLWLNFQLPPAYRTRVWMLAAGVASAAILMVVAAVSGLGVWQQIARLLGPR